MPRVQTLRLSHARADKVVAQLDAAAGALDTPVPDDRALSMALADARAALKALTPFHEQSRAASRAAQSYDYAVAGVGVLGDVVASTTDDERPYDRSTVIRQLGMVRMSLTTAANQLRA
jgi:hypothetical protein